MSPERRRSVMDERFGEWDPMRIGLIYGEFRGKNTPGVRYFNLFKEMILGMRIPRDLMSRNAYEFTANFMDRNYFIQFRVNEKGTNMNDDYKVITGNKAIRTLRQLMKEDIKPFWIEIQGEWSNILFKERKKKYMAQVILDK